MKRAINSLGLITRLSDRAMPYALLSVVLPLLILAGFGLYAVFRYGYLVHFILILLGCTLLSSIGLLLARRKLRERLRPAVAHALEQSPKTPTYWTERDRAAQQEVLADIAELLKEDASWQALPNHSLAVLRAVASRYNLSAKRAHWAFTAPELLAITEQVSRRYRRVLTANVPGVEHIRISTLMSLNDQVERYGPWAMKLFGAYRAVRLLSPQGLVAEMLTQLRGEVFDGLSEELQGKLKYLLLLEVLRAGVDLYGGHFRVDDEQLKSARVTHKDDDRRAPKLDPVRVGLIGQVGAGKSSVINALTGGMNAEVSALPATEGVQVYECAVEGGPALRLVDLPGLNGSEAVEKLLFEQIRHCDLVLWVLKANQPARSLDQHFRKKIEEWFAQPRHVGHQPPVIIGVLSQVDRLVPNGSWPEDMVLAGDAKAARATRDALDYNREVLGFSLLLPLSLAPGHRPFQLAELQQALQTQYAAAVNVQLNRRRREAGDFSVSKEMDRVKSAAVGLFKLLR